MDYENNLANADSLWLYVGVCSITSEWINVFFMK